MWRDRGRKAEYSKPNPFKAWVVLHRTDLTVLNSDTFLSQALERILYCWAIRHPASGYVQGINDLVTPFYSVFLAGQLNQPLSSLNSLDVDSIDPKLLSTVEADSYWCLSKLLDGIQDNYTFAQPGIQRQIVRLRDLINRIDAPLAAHLNGENVEFVQFAFRWINCLLMREVPLRSIVRMWDTYLVRIFLLRCDLGRVKHKLTLFTVGTRRILRIPRLRMRGILG